jgi:hypothetical protein
MNFYSLEKFPGAKVQTSAILPADRALGDPEWCPACGEPVSSLTWLAPLTVHLRQSGTEFGDCIFSEGGGDWIGSEKLRVMYIANRLEGIARFDPVEVVGVKSCIRNLTLPPSYFRIVATYGGPALDPAASGVEWREPPRCALCLSGHVLRWRRLVIEPGTWTGEDVFRPRGMSSQILVSQRFKEICDANGITNAIFTPAEEAGHDFYPWENQGRSEQDEIGRDKA